MQGDLRVAVGKKEFGQGVEECQVVIGGQANAGLLIAKFVGVLANATTEKVDTPGARHAEQAEYGVDLYDLEAVMTQDFAIRPAYSGAKFIRFELVELFYLSDLQFDLVAHKADAITHRAPVKWNGDIGQL